MSHNTSILSHLAERFYRLEVALDETCFVTTHLAGFAAVDDRAGEAF
jgi:hypothetical protein